MTKARIFKPAKNAMQSGRAKSNRWHLVFEPATPGIIDPLTGHVGASDAHQQIRLQFDTLQMAIDYATRNKVAFEVMPQKDRKKITKAYADNFATSRIEGNWTH
ncbi:NADH dehydrogenase ubiquinone Fe-S protein 4 [uncultured Cohaesibacter sp.]|uniref:NADH dehydrogenase ubiquinone Fe-S protein 4 n=1 Tax=uncultured Cohaesibacter sp. TaxID=1002546 RepID=UPI002930A2C8|nr:NADH dehydrogenase ubiquinone Fe-S protein 4 [uncultured Cohaesibacter sp.]